MGVWDASLAILDIIAFISAITAYYNSTDVKGRQKAIQKVLNLEDWHEHYRDRKTGRRVLSELPGFKHLKELRSAILLAQTDYDVVFAPSAMFRREEKKFDIYLLRDTLVSIEIA